MGAGILPTTIHNNKLFFLFGKENRFEDSAPGFSDFGGGTDDNETYMQTAIREAGEELTGFLGSNKDVKQMLKKHGTYNIDYASAKGYKNYRMHIFPFEYDEALVHYYNNNAQFLQSRLDPEVIKKTKIFEKVEIRWICVDDIVKMRPQFRSYFQNIVDLIVKEKDAIQKFIVSARLKKRTVKRTPRNKTRKSRRS
jgi:8-oxo-dGTP pyrophosphatase MutT (NUDIX family)